MWSKQGARCARVCICTKQTPIGWFDRSQARNLRLMGILVASNWIVGWAMKCAIFIFQLSKCVRQWLSHGTSRFGTNTRKHFFVDHAVVVLDTCLVASPMLVRKWLRKIIHCWLNAAALSQHNQMHYCWPSIMNTQHTHTHNKHSIPYTSHTQPQMFVLEWPSSY